MLDHVTLALPALSAGWYENRRRGLVYTQSPTELTLELYFPETVGQHDIEIVRIKVDGTAAHCRVTEAFGALFYGETRSYHVVDRVLFSTTGGVEAEEATTMEPSAWLEKNVRATEKLLATIEERRSCYRDEYLPQWDLDSGRIAKGCKEYRFSRTELATPALSAQEFCRRFAHKDWFKALYHPELSVLRFFER
jgi:hypothetical protein